MRIYKKDVLTVPCVPHLSCRISTNFRHTLFRVRIEPSLRDSASQVAITIDHKSGRSRHFWCARLSEINCCRAHDNGRTPMLIGDTSSNSCLSVVVLVFGGVYVKLVHGSGLR